MQREFSQKTLFIRNIDYKATVNELKDLFTEYGEIKSAKILTIKFHGKFVSRGIGFVEFVEEESFLNAFEKKDSFELNGRNLKIMRAFVKEEPKGDTAFVAGIPENTSNQEILNSLAKYNAKNSKIVRHNNEKRKGFAFVQFNSKEERNKAVSLKTFELNGEESFIKNAHKDFDSQNKMKSSYKKNIHKKKI